MNNEENLARLEELKNTFNKNKEFLYLETASYSLEGSPELVNMELERKGLGLESGSLVNKGWVLTKKFIGTMKSGIETISQSLSNYFSDMDEVTETSKGLVKSRTKMKSKMKEIKFSSIYDLRFSCPVGLNSGLSKLGETLLDKGPYVIDRTVELLTDFNNFAAVVYSDDLEKNRMKDLQLHTKESMSLTKEAVENLSKVIMKGSSTDSLSLGRLVGNSSGIVENIDIIRNLEPDMSFGKIENIKLLTKNLNDKIDYLITAIKNKEATQFSKQNITNIVDGLEAAATMVTVAGSYYYTYIGYVNSMSKIVKAMEKR